MPIKQLQLRGISRNPSDRATVDGGCAESLNVHLDQNETAPTLPPVDVSDDVYGANRSASDKYQIVFIHKMIGVTNYIGFNGTNRGLRAYGSTLSGGMDTMGNAALSSGETYRMSSSIGNTLIVYSDVKPYYFLFKDGAYISLGNAIPAPMIEVATLPVNPTIPTGENHAPNVNPRVPIAEGELRGDENPAPISTWGKAANPGNENHAALLETMGYVWDAAKELISKFRQQGVFSVPFFIRYALRLYDGSYIHVSSPILCGCGRSTDWLSVVSQNFDTISIDTHHSYYSLRLTLNNLFKIAVKGSFSAGNWSDLIESIDFFASDPIYTPAIESGFADMDANRNFVFETMDSATRGQTMKDAVLSKGQFYKIVSIDVGNTTDMTALAGGKYEILASDNVSGDLLATHEELDFSYRDDNQYNPAVGTMNFNNRLLLIGASETLTRGDTFMNGQVIEDSGASVTTIYRYAFRYKIVDSATGKAHYVMAHYYDGGTQIYQGVYSKKSEGGTRLDQLSHGNSVPSTSGLTYYDCWPSAWLCYPDRRCKQVEVFFFSTTGVYESGKVIPMEEHPLLECSYAFLGFGVKLRDIAYSTAYATAPSSDYGAVENRTLDAGNKLFLSELENPFLFPAGNILTFSDRLVGAATTSVPLSEGQFGEFPMYVFTEGGIRMLVTTAEGTFAATMTPPNLSRHVAIPGTILPLEQAVVFITKKGVMLLAGSRVMELSQGINGEPFVLSGPSGSDLLAIRNGLSISTWSNLVPATIDTSTFMGFMTGAKPAYDHNGARLIFFNPSKTYQYVYMMETKTWHKIDYHLYYNAKILNSYPECLVSVDPAAAPAPLAVMDYSTVLDDATIYADAPADNDDPVQPVKGIIVTRPFDLGEPDIRKAIRNIRIRGYYNRQDVQYILLGSFDGHTWKHMTSLRGGSYKMFRLILLTRLMPKERISWIDVDYESRMTNRLR